VIAQLANALFVALPGRPTLPGTAADAQAVPPAAALPSAPPLVPGSEVGSQPVATYVPPTSGFSPPGDAELRAAPASLASLGGVPSPATAANPSGDPSYYFLEPDLTALPGTAVDFSPSSASRLETGSLSTAPSPPAAFAQPAEPSLGSLPGLAASASVPVTGGGASTSVPFAFRPELVPDIGSVPLGGGSSKPSSVPTVALPQETGALLPAAAVPPVGAVSPSTEFGPRDSLGGNGLPPLVGVTAVPSFYFLEEANPQIGSATPILNIENLDFTRGVFGVETGAYPLDSRQVVGDSPAQQQTGEWVPTGGAPSTIPGQEASNHPLRVDNSSPPGIAEVGQG
jgi:hypothetical protein